MTSSMNHTLTVNMMFKGYTKNIYAKVDTLFDLLCCWLFEWLVEAIYAMVVVFLVIPFHVHVFLVILFLVVIHLHTLTIFFI